MRDTSSERSSWKAWHRIVLALWLLLLALVLILREEPEWKRIQKTVHRYQAEQLELRLQTERGMIEEQRVELELQLAEQVEILASRRDQVDRFEGDLAALVRRRQAAERRRDEHQAILAGLRHEASQAETDDARAAIQDRINETRDVIRLARVEIESVAELERMPQHELRVLRGEFEAVSEQLQNLEGPIADLETRWVHLDHQKPQVHEVEVPDYPRVGATPRQDRCITCHLGLDGSLESGPDGAVYDPHPRLGFFVGPTSPHAMDRVGCTACHGGEGMALDFSRAGHVPRDEAQAADWRARWGWRADHVPPDTILSGPAVEAACTSCHNSRRIGGADRLNAGLEQLEQLGCGSCHEGGVNPVPAPPLNRLAAKTTPAWVYRWIAAPRALNPQTRMPHLFDLQTVDPVQRQYQDAEIRAIVTWLWQQSEPFEPSVRGMRAGNAEAGEVLFTSIGCEGCHRGEATDPSFGPGLNGLGSKVDASWLYAWLRNPRAYHPSTHMPDLRLSEREASDLTAYLLLSSGSDSEMDEWSELEPARRDDLVLAYLQLETTVEGSQAQLEDMNAEARELFLGERAYHRHGCSACHGGSDAPALEPPPWPSAAGGQSSPHFASDDRPALTAFEYVDLPPRPRYAVGEEEEKRVSLAWAALYRPRLRWVPTSAEQQTLSRGRELVERHGCRGCHRIEKQNDAPSAWNRPAPDLTGYGARIRPRWLVEYLAEPSAWTLRPWQSLRMPSYGLSAAERRDLAAYFAALEDRSLWVEDPPIVPLDAAVGAVVYDLLHCSSCHQGASSSSEPAPPPYDLARQRLRADWVVEWILDPHAIVPETTMPDTFAYESRQQTDSFLSMAIGAPMYWQERGRLRRFFKTEEAMVEYLSDPENLARALQAHLWGMGRG